MVNIVRDVEKNLAPNQQLKTGEIPTNLAPVLTRAGPAAMSWGFPKWAGKGVVINARAETVVEKPLFRQAVMSRRLVVPSTGFFEWKHTEGKKQKEKYWFRLRGSHVLYMAGLYTEYKQPDGSAEK